MKKRKGFTLIEIMVVVIILGLLAGFVVPKVFSNIGTAKASVAKSKMSLIEGALAQFMTNCGRLPTDAEGLDALITPPSGLEEKWGDSPYLKQSQLLDPWGNPYVYVADGTVNPGSFDIVSYGADGQPGGEGDNADIYND